MLTRRQNEWLLIVLAILLVAVYWIVTSSNNAMPTLPRSFSGEEAEVVVQPVPVAQPDLIDRQLETVRLPVRGYEADAERFVNTPAWPDYAVNVPGTVSRPQVMPDLLERQLERRDLNLVPVPTGDFETGAPLAGADYRIGLPILTERTRLAQAQLAAPNTEYRIGLPILTERTRLAAAPNPEYVIGLPILTARTTGAEVARVSLNWADYAPVIGSVAAQRAQAAAISAEYHVGLPILTERARLARERQAAPNAEYQVGLPLLTERTRAAAAGRVPIAPATPAMAPRIFEASLNWADYAGIEAERPLSAARIFATSLNWSDFAPGGTLVETMHPERWSGPTIREASLNWADYAR